MNIIRRKYSKLDDIRKVAVLADPACRSGWERNFLPLLARVWRIHRPDLFLVAGDFAVDGTSEEFRTVISSIKEYPAWMAVVPGDHDRPLRTFRSYFGSTRKVVDAGRWRFIGCNTAERMFPKSEAEFLENNIRRDAVIFTHVPPGLDGWTFHSLGPLYSKRFLSIVDRRKAMIHAAFFGHIHGYSRMEYRGIPFIATGGVAESFAIRNNRYDGPGIFQMMVFDTATGGISLCRSGC
jgi:hypothetical protein